MGIAERTKTKTGPQRARPPRRIAPYTAACVALCALTAAAQNGLGSLQVQLNPSSAQNPYYGSITVGKASDQVLKLSLDDAIQRGIQNNLAITQARIDEKQSRAEKLEYLDPLLPRITGDASTAVHQFDLVQFGFSPSTLRSFASHLPPGFKINSFPFIVKVDVTQAQANYHESLDLSSIERYRAARVSTRAAYYNTQSARGLVVLNVGNTYLQTLADGSQVDSAKALARADELLLQQTEQEHAAGTAARLDELRARVQFQLQQQRVIAAQNQYEKDLVLLKRETGIPAEQAVQLTDAAPYADLEAMNIEDAKRQAYQSRQDFQGLQQQILAAELQKKAAKYERLPSLHADGNYGVTGLTHGLYHGTFVAQGSIEVPLFKEAQFRGDAEVADAQLGSLRRNFDNLRGQIDQQLRDSMLDVQSAQELVRVAQSNVSLATEQLQQANDRFLAGVEDNLAVVQAQAAVANAQTQLINDTLQYNQAKLGLARNLGIVDTQYKAYLHGN